MPTTETTRTTEMTVIKKQVWTLEVEGSETPSRHVFDIEVTEETFTVTLAGGPAIMIAPLDMLVWQLCYMEPDLLRFVPR